MLFKFIHVFLIIIYPLDLFWLINNPVKNAVYMRRFFIEKILVNKYYTSTKLFETFKIFSNLFICEECIQMH